SQHELTQAGVYQDRADPSLFVRFPLLDHEGEFVVVWTTTPWTLPANVAAAVHPDEQYGRRENGEWVAVELFPKDRFVERLPGSALVGRRYRGPFDDLPPGASVEHRVIPWEDVTMDQGTGIVHIAPGCGGEDFELSKRSEERRVGKECRPRAWAHRYKKKIPWVQKDMQTSLPGASRPARYATRYPLCSELREVGGGAGCGRPVAGDATRAQATFFFSSRRRHTRFDCDWSSDVCSSDLDPVGGRDDGPGDGDRAHRSRLRW